MLDPSLLSIQRLVWVSLMAALIAVGAFIHVPLGPAPISLQTFFVMLAGFVLGPMRGSLAVALYLTAGFIGLPVFAGGTSGFARILGPTGGFLLGFFLQAFLAGIATRDRSKPLSWPKGLTWGALSTLATFTLGFPWLKTMLDIGWGEALTLGVLPFLPGAVIKLTLAVATYRFMDQRSLLPS